MQPELQFEWDAGKAAQNVRKHGVSFEEARTVFADEAGRILHDPDSGDDEDRFLLLGFSAALRLLIVCHCERGENWVRIISARKATRNEARQYTEG